MPFVHRLRVRYNECDPQGHVFNGNFVTYFDVALTELWREAFGAYSDLVDRGLDLVVGEIVIRFLSPARFDDELDVAVSVARLGTTGMTSEIAITHVGEARTVAEGHIRHVFVRLDSTEKAPIPGEVRERLAAYR